MEGDPDQLGDCFFRVLSYGAGQPVGVHQRDERLSAEDHAGGDNADRFFFLCRFISEGTFSMEVLVGVRFSVGGGLDRV